MSFSSPSRFAASVAMTIFVLVQAPLAQWQWGINGGGTPGYRGNYGIAVKTLPQGGFVNLSVCYRPGALNLPVSDVMNNGATALAKFSMTGEMLWSKIVELHHETSFLEVTPSGNILVGSARLLGFSDSGDSMEFPVPDSFEIAAATVSSRMVIMAGRPHLRDGGFDFFAGIVRMDSSGQKIWTTKFGKNVLVDEMSIAQLHNGTAVVAGKWYGSSRNPSFIVGDDQMVSKGGTEAFMVCVDSVGNILWACSFGGIGNDGISSIVASPDTTLYIAGYFEETLAYQNQSRTSVGGEDWFVMRVNAAGECLFLKSFGSPLAHDRCNALALTDDQRLWIAGTIGDSGIIDGRLMRTAGSTDAFVFSMDSNGNFQTVESFGGSSLDEGTGIAIMGQGLVITGTYSGTIDIGPVFLSGQTSKHFDMFTAYLSWSNTRQFSSLPLSTGSFVMRSPLVPNRHSQSDKWHVDAMGRTVRRSHSSGIRWNGDHSGMRTKVMFRNDHGRKQR